MPARPPAAARPRPRPLSRAAVVLAASAGLLLATVAGAPAASARTSLFLPLTGTFVTSAGTFTLSGTANVVAPPNPVIPGNPILPPNPIRATLRDTAATSGEVTCRATGTASHQPAGGEDEVTFTGSYRFSPQDACDPLGVLRVTYRVTYDEAGEPVTVTAQVIDGEIVT